MPKIWAPTPTVDLRRFQKLVVDWDPSLDLAAACGRPLVEPQPLRLWNEKAKRVTDRFVIAGDGLLLCCKGDTTFRVKEKVNMRNAVVVPEPDMHDLKFAIRIEAGPGADRSRVILVFDSEEAQTTWLSLLLPVTLARFLAHEHQRKREQQEADLSQMNLSVLNYPFSEPDSPANIRFEGHDEAVKASDADKKLGAPVVKGATLIKLVERLTYPKYADLNFLRHFLTTFRSFTTPEELLQLLIQRYKVPVPNLDQILLKYFQKVYIAPVRLRVLNVLKHWVEKHYYDFEKSVQLLKMLLQFIRDYLAVDPAMKKGVTTLTKVIRKRREIADAQKLTMWSDGDEPFDTLWLVGSAPPSVMHVLTLHPLELARQLTLIESNIYRAITAPELVGQAWSRPDKEMHAPRVLQLIYRFNAVNHWILRTIVETEHLPERVDVVNFLLEVLRELLALNNFNCAMAFVSSLQSSSIKRLKFTWAEISPKKRRILDDACEVLSREKNFAGLRAKMASCNPPLIPYLGMYLTDLTFIEDGSPDFLPLDDDKRSPSALINFGKRRLVAKTTGDIQQFQNTPYIINEQPEICTYLLACPSPAPWSLALPMDGASKADVERFEAAIHAQSLVIESRTIVDKGDLLNVGCKLFADVSLKKARQDLIGGTFATKSIRSRTPSRTSIRPSDSVITVMMSRGSFRGPGPSVARSVSEGAVASPADAVPGVPARPPSRSLSLASPQFGSGGLAGSSDTDFPTPVPPPRPAAPLPPRAGSVSTAPTLPYAAQGPPALALWSPHAQPPASSAAQPPARPPRS